MSWARLCGSFCFHRKVLEADSRTRDRASGAFARLLAWSAENLTGGQISAPIALTITKDRKVLDALVAVGLLDRDEEDYVLHDFCDYNPTGEELAARREELRTKRSEAGRRGAAARWGDGKPKEGWPFGSMANDGKGDGNLPCDFMANRGKGHGKKMPTSPSPSPSPPPSVVDFALTRVEVPPEPVERKRTRKPRTAQHSPEVIAAKNRVVQTFVECFKAKKQVEPKSILDVDHAKAFELAQRFGADESCSIVRRAFEHDFVVRENATLRYIVSRADTYRGTTPRKTSGRREQQQAVGDEPWLREHLS